MKLPAEILTPHEVESLLASFGSSPTGRRNLALVCLAYGAGLKVGEVLALERRHYQPGRQTLLVPPRKRAPEREVRLDTPTRGALDRWMERRKQLRVRVTAPLLCTVSAGAAGHRMSGSYVRAMLRDKGTALGIDRRVTAEGLRHSGKQHRLASQWRMESDIGRYIDEGRFQELYPEAHEACRMALDLYAADPRRHASAVGSACRNAIAEFVAAALRIRGIMAEDPAGTVDRLRALIRNVATSQRVSAHGEALVRYWGTVADLANRQSHGALREAEPLEGEDARRLIFHTMVVMYEVDRLART